MLYIFIMLGFFILCLHTITESLKNDSMETVKKIEKDLKIFTVLIALLLVFIALVKGEETVVIFVLLLLSVIFIPLMARKVYQHPTNVINEKRNEDENGVDPNWVPNNLVSGFLDLF